MTDADKAAARIQTRLDIYDKAIDDDWSEELALELAGYQNPADIKAVLADRKRQAERIAELELVPRCGATTPALLGDGIIGPCILDHGHDGMHQEGSHTDWPGLPGARWTERNDAHACCPELNRTVDDDGEPITGCDCICHIDEEASDR